MREIIPTVTEVHRWLLGTVRHVLHIEYFLQELQIGSEDPERPHDIIGPGNKFEWDVIRGLALQYRPNCCNFFESHLKPSLQKHRQQYHHSRWNEPKQPTSPSDAMKLGAVDTLCSFLEPDRLYSGGRHSWEEIEHHIGTSQPHKIRWLQDLLPEMKRLPQPRLEKIQNLSSFPNIGTSCWAYEIVCQRVDETLHVLHNDFGYDHATLRSLQQLPVTSS